MNTKIVKISQVKPNAINPRLIKDSKFKQLVKSIQEFPEMLNLRPIVVDAEMVVLGGNMRLRACIEAGLIEVPVVIADDLTPEQQKEFIIKDNVGFGEWDWDILANEWDAQDLTEWGLDVWQPSDVSLDDFFSENNSKNENDKASGNIITLEYNQDDYNTIIDAFNKLGGSKEKIVFDLLKCK